MVKITKEAFALSSLGIYLLIGMFTFSHIARPSEEYVLEPEQIYEFSLTNGIIELNSSLLEVDYVEIITDPTSSGGSKIRFVSRAGIDRNIQNLMDKWSYPGSLFFSMTVITTIGYGNLSPSTDVGRAVCVAYAVFGLPILAVVMDWVKSLLLKAANSMQICLYKRRHVGEPSNEDLNNKFILFGISLFGYLILITLPSIIFWRAEGWTYMSAMYYNFVSLSTIGRRFG